MNSNPDLGCFLYNKVFIISLGSFWKGRILLALSSVPEESPKLESINLTGQILDQFKKSDQMEWMISGEILFGLNFPDKDEKYSIQIRWADQELNFDKLVLYIYINLKIKSFHNT